MKILTAVAFCVLAIAFLLSCGAGNDITSPSEQLDQEKTLRSLDNLMATGTLTFTPSDPEEAWDFGGLWNDTLLTVTGSTVVTGTFSFDHPQGSGEVALSGTGNYQQTGVDTWRILFNMQGFDNGLGARMRIICNNLTKDAEEAIYAGSGIVATRILLPNGTKLTLESTCNIVIDITSAG